MVIVRPVLVVPRFSSNGCNLYCAPVYTSNAVNRSETLEEFSFLPHHLSVWKSYISMLVYLVGTVRYILHIGFQKVYASSNLYFTLIASLSLAPSLYST